MCPLLPCTPVLLSWGDFCTLSAAGSTGDTRNPLRRQRKSLFGDTTVGQHTPCDPYLTPERRLLLLPGNL